MSSAAMQVVKKTTGLTGLAVARTPDKTLAVIYDKIIRALNKVPKEAAYRVHTEELIKSRLAIVQSAKSITEIEEKINCGQLEEVIIQAQNELSLARNLVKSRPWENPIEDIPPNQWTWPPSVIPKLN